MPVIKTAKGYKWGKTGKVYPTKKQAERQGRAIKSSKSRRGQENIMAGMRGGKKKKKKGSRRG